MVKTLRLSLIAALPLGLVLEGLVVLGFLMPPVADAPDRAATQNYYQRTMKVSHALEAFAALKEYTLDDASKAEKLFELISRSYVHTQSRYEIKPWDDWLFWMTDRVFRHANHNIQYLPVMDIDLLWKRGGGLCSQAARIYAEKAEELGLRARTAAIPGHVIAEVFVPERGWLLVDPDFGIYWNKTAAEVQTMLGRKGVTETFLAHGFTQSSIERVVASYLSEQQQWTRSWRDRVELREYQVLTQKLSIMIPLLLIVIGSAAGAYSRLFSRKTRSRV